jgi:hypothetical protein
MTALIELLCRAHPTAEGPGPLITPVDQMWAYCEGRGTGGHDWTRIEPTRRDHLGDRSQVQERRAG